METEIPGPFSHEWLTHREPARKVIELLSRSHLTLGVIDGAGGELLNQLTIPGATKVFRMGVVANSPEAKIRLGVPAAVIYKYGEQSLETATYLAVAALRLQNDPIGIATTDNYIAIAKKTGQLWHTDLPRLRHSESSGSQIQFSLAQAALSLLSVYLQNKQHHNQRLPHLSGFTALHSPLEHTSYKLQQLAQILLNTRQQLAIMESCSGGAVAAAFNSLSPQLVESAAVTYTEDAKIKSGVPIEALAYGAVYSERVALAMAEAIQKETGAAIAIATTGTMDTADTRPFHTDSSPGTVFIAIRIKGVAPIARKLQLPIHSREQMKAVIVDRIIDELWLLVARETHLTNTVADTLTYPPAIALLNSLQKFLD